MRFHLLGVPHTVSNSDYVACAYTQKIVKFCSMFENSPNGDDVKLFHYGHEDSDVKCFEHITVTTNEDMIKSYGSYDWRKNFFKFDVKDHIYHEYNKNTIRAILTRYQKNDIILAFFGAGNQVICEAIQKVHSEAIIVEPGIGYGSGSFAQWKIYESYAIMHACQGAQKVTNCDPKWYEIVIPNYFDCKDFLYNEEKEDYYLYLGRVYEGKGVHIAIDACKRAGVKLKIAGQLEPNFKIPDEVEYLGYADVDQRRELMSKAKASFLPTLYCEPFGGVQIENLLSGTPTITTDWGAFSENNLHGVTGYRCRNMGDFLEAIERIERGEISSKDCVKQGLNFSLDNIRGRYLKYFKDILNVYEGKGWYATENRGDFLSLK